LAATAAPPGASAQVAQAVRGAVQEAFVAGYRWIMVVSAALALASAGVAAVFLDRERRES
jgi:hypothetical protein